MSGENSRISFSELRVPSERVDGVFSGARRFSDLHRWVSG